MQFKTTSTYACYLAVLFLCLTAGCLKVSGATYITTSVGVYEDRSIWDVGRAPGPSDTVIINHDVTTMAGIAYSATGKLDVNAGGTLQINGTLSNGGEIYIYGSIDVAGGAVNDNFIFIDAGRKLEVLGDFVNNGLITNEGIVIVQGTMTNFGTADGTGHYDVCGITTNEGHAESTLTLCQICGEKYTNKGTGTYTELCGSLPVVLNYFTASAGNGFVKLNWETETESSTDYFLIQRSDLDGNFQDVLQVNAAGNSSQARTYEAADLAPVPGESIYRLTTVDKNGDVSSSENVTVNYELSASAQLKVYPNPSEGIINLRFQEVPDGDITIRVLDLSGSVKQQITADPYADLDLSLDLSNLPGGYYILLGEYAGGSVSQKVLLF